MMQKCQYNNGIDLSAMDYPACLILANVCIVGPLLANATKLTISVASGNLYKLY